MTFTPLLVLALLPAFAVASMNIIGYYGNSGNAVSEIPIFRDIHPNYNIVIITFASIDSTGKVTLDIQGPYEHDLPGMKTDIASWKQHTDPFSRPRKVLVSIGGQNGQWPAGLSAEVVEAGLASFMSEYGLDGLDIDLEGQAVAAATSLIPVIKSLVSSGMLVTAAPEAAQGPLEAYKGMLQYLTWVHPQFYNNGPNAVTTPYLPSADLWPTPWTVSDWQNTKNNTAFWAGVLDAIGVAAGLHPEQLGMLIPSTPSAASSYNHWDIQALAQQVTWANIKHVGNWALAYDRKNGYEFATTMGKLNELLA